MKVGLVGCGAIGTYIAELIEQKYSKSASLTSVYDISEKNVNTLSSSVSNPPEFTTLFNLIQQSDLVIEAAHVSCVKEVVTQSLKLNKDILVMSVGGLLELEDLKSLSDASKGALYIPSGAIAGVDALSAAMQKGIEKVTLVTRKPIQSLLGAPFLKEKGIDVESITEEVILFEGLAQDAVKAFPQNVNVAAVLSMATLGADQVQVKVITSPEFKRNSHEIVAEGKFGTIRTVTENEPSETNPKTSALAQYSLAATLDKIFSNIKIGT